ncbi:hypothetical protein D3C83_110520 [compost metagenome]
MRSNATSPRLSRWITQPSEAKLPSFGRYLVNDAMARSASCQDLEKPPLMSSWLPGQSESREMEMSLPPASTTWWMRSSVARPLVCMRT